MRPDYFDKYPTLVFERNGRGILTLRIHSDGGPAKYTMQHHGDWCGAFYDIGADPENRVVVITGTGDVFLDEWGQAEAFASPSEWDQAAFEGRRMIRNYLDIEVPIIAAVNGPATIHNEIAVMADIVIAADTATFQDKPHFPQKVPPGDGIQVIWEALLGINRARYFLLTGQILTAKEALDLGVVSEVLNPESLIPRAVEIAEQLADYPTLSLRMTKAVILQQLRRQMDERLTSSITLEGMAVMDMLTTHLRKKSNKYKDEIAKLKGQ